MDVGETGLGVMVFGELGWRGRWVDEGVEVDTGIAGESGGVLLFATSLNAHNHPPIQPNQQQKQQKLTKDNKKHSMTQLVCQ